MCKSFQFTFSWWQSSFFFSFNFFQVLMIEISCFLKKSYKLLIRLVRLCLGCHTIVLNGALWWSDDIEIMGLWIGLLTRMDDSRWTWSLTIGVTFLRFSFWNEAASSGTLSRLTSKYTGKYPWIYPLKTRGYRCYRVTGYFSGFPVIFHRLLLRKTYLLLMVK